MLPDPLTPLPSDEKRRMGGAWVAWHRNPILYSAQVIRYPIQYFAQYSSIILQKLGATLHGPALVPGFMANKNSPLAFPSSTESAGPLGATSQNDPRGL